MKSLKLLEADTIDDFEFLYEIESDPEIINYYHPNFDGKEVIEISSCDLSYKEYMEQDKKKIYIVHLEEERIGTFSVTKDFEYLVNEEKDNLAWISLAFNKKYFGKQVIKDSYFLFEELLRNSGYKKIELGVFEFNKRAIKFYEKIGYKKITSLKNFTCYAGKWWDDYRYEKNL